MVWPSAHSPCQNEHFVNSGKKVPKNSNKTFPVVRTLHKKVDFLSNIL